MIVSILHRVTGMALTFAGLGLMTWWLLALSNGPDAYASFVKVAKSAPGLIVLIGLSWSAFQHVLSGIRHLIMDSGAGFELPVNKSFAVMTMIGSILLTILLWVYLLGLVK